MDVSAAWQLEMDHLRRRIEALEDVVNGTVTIANEECCGCGPACGACEPAPVPEWRRLVDDERRDPGADALSDVLENLAIVAVSNRTDGPPYGELARIVAVCEAEGGDDWEADPSGWVAKPALHALLRYLAVTSPNGPGSAWPETDWRGLANAAAAWLRDLTEDGAA